MESHNAIKPKKIFVADDDSSILDAIQIILEEEEYDVRTTNNGALVEEKVIEYLPDLVLLDIWMSGQDGREICRKLKQNNQTQHIPIIMISANRDTEVMSQDCGADGYIAKPFEIDELLSKVANYTSKK